METKKETAHVKLCCDRAHRQLVKDLWHCDAPALTPKQKHRCYRHAAWRSGRKARRCASES
ncbi:MAG: hypothetical protein QNI89_08675 [Desulfobacterales bacterium]|nr:hypothetical protein [Desulfobacterales bacterium]MDJ0856349.1 hypothetical protein [Desulfobacterales bacterium]MDJ0887360.1 hypothetical protein [Desulfobacterales bacterium]MDJ0990875.1 hypothetical protein [Desulfobacterales bacterium]